MDESTTAKVFNYVAFPQLSEHFGTEDFTRWEEEAMTPVRIDLVRPKTSYRYFTFLAHDAVMLLKEYLVMRRKVFGEIKIYGSQNPKASRWTVRSLAEASGTGMKKSRVQQILKSLET